MKSSYKYSILLAIVFCNFASYLQAQYFKKPINQPFADQKMYHLGFLVGFHGQDLIFTHTGSKTDNETWFAEIPSYSVGLNVGIIGDRYINEYLNLRLSPTLYFGNKQFTFIEENSRKEIPVSFKSSYLTLPLELKFSAARVKNYRPYIIGGGYVAMDIAPSKGKELRFEKLDYGVQLGIGCNFYLPLFKLCPELKFSFGLKDIISKDKTDITDHDMLKFRNAINSGKTRMISLTFNFE